MLIASWKTAAAFLAAPVACSASAQDLPQPALEFPTEAYELSLFSTLTMGIWKPAGKGPFPALIIVHSCAGLKEPVGYWRKQAVEKGYVVLVIDSFSSRGSPNCRPRAPIPKNRGVKDILDASAHMRKLPFVDPSRVAVLGLSWGAMAGMLSGSPGYVSEFAAGAKPPAAAVSIYPACYIGPFGNFPGNEFLRSDIATPTLLLLGEEDTETPPEECTSRLPRLKEKNAPVEWHVFKGATHCWDCSEQDNQRWSPPWAGGRSVVYRYDNKITEESANRAFEFLSGRLAPSGKN